MNRKIVIVVSVVLILALAYASMLGLKSLKKQPQKDINRKKTPMFTEVERTALVEASIGHLDNVDVVYDDGLLVDYVEANNYDVIVKGLRAISDFEAEFQMAAINRRLKAVDTVFIMTRTEYMYISSSVVKEVHSFGGEIGQFVSPVVKEAMIQKGRA